MEIPLDLDAECRNLFVALNTLPGIETTGSCCGHGHSSYDISFHAKTTTDLFPILRAVDRRYAGGCFPEWTWRVEADLLDVHPFVVFRLTSGVVSNDLIYRQADHIAVNIREERFRLAWKIVAKEFEFQ